MLRPVRLFVDDEKLLQLSSGECVQGVKTPCAFNKNAFQSYMMIEMLTSVEKYISPRWAFWQVPKRLQCLKHG